MGTRNGLFFALEAEELAQDQTGDVAQGAADVAQISEDATAGQTEVDNSVSDIDDAAAGADELTQVADVMDQTVQTGEGASPEAAQLAQIQVESICARLGMRSSSVSVIPSTESFGSKHTRLSATKIAVESVMEKVKSIWEAVKKAFITLWNKIKDFIAKLFQNTDAVKKQAVKVKALLQTRSSWKEEKGDIDVGGGTAKALGANGEFKMETVTSILKNHAGFTKSSNGVFDSVGKVLAIVNNFLVGVKDKKHDTQTVMGDLLTQATDSFLAATTNDVETSPAKKDAGKKSTTATCGPFLNGEFVNWEVGTGKVPTARLYLSPGEKKVTTTTFKDGGAAQGVTICDSVIALMDATEIYKKNLPAMEKINKEFVAVTEGAIKLAQAVSATAAESGGANEIDSALAQAKTFVTGLNSSLMRYTSLVPSANVRVGKAALHLCSKIADNRKDPASK